jgi:hypothetical protein
MSRITIDRAVLEQALKLLDALSCDENYDYDGCFQHWTDYARPEKLALQFRAALEQPQVEQEPTPNGATHRQPKQGAFYKRVDGRWYVWSRMESGGSHRWYISPGTTESCLDPIYTHPQPPRQPLTEEEIRDLFQDQRAFPRLLKFIRVIEEAHGIKEQK